MKIICLQGSTNCGKTSTLNIVYTSLLKAGGLSTNKELLGANPNDFSDIVLYQNKNIAFYTMGDYANPLLKAIEDYQLLKVDILIIALNTNLKSPIKKIQKNEHLLVQKSIAVANIPDNYLIVNTNDAQIIINEIL